MHIRQFIGYMLLVVLVFGLAGTTVAQEPITIDTLPILENGAVVSAAFDNEVNTHLYAFHATGGDFVTVSMVQDVEELDPLLVLLDAAGVVLAVDDDSGSSVFLSAEIAGFEMPADGTYLILASSLPFLESANEELAEMSYTLSLVGNNLPEGFTTDSVDLLATPLFFGDVVEGQIALETPIAVFAFEGLTGQIVNIVVASDEFPTVLYVFDPAGARLAVDPSAVSELELAEDGLYLVLTTDVFFYEVLLEDTFFVGGLFTLAIDGS